MRHDDILTVASDGEWLKRLQDLDLVVTDHEIQDVIENEELVQNLIQLQREVVVPRDRLIGDAPYAGIYFAHSKDELFDVLNSPGARLLTLRRRQADRVLAKYIFHVDGSTCCSEDHHLFESARAYFAATLPPERVARLKVGVTHLVIVGDEFRTMSHAAELPRGTGYAILHQFKAAEEQRSGIEYTVATCRVKPAPNTVAMETHAKLAGFFDSGMRISQHVPDDATRMIESAVLVAEPLVKVRVPVSFVSERRSG